MTVTACPDIVPAAARGDIALAPRPDMREPARERLDTIAAAGRDLAHAVNNGLCLPLGVLELLEQQSEPPEDLRALVTTAREVLERTAAQAQQFQTILRAST